MNLSLISQMLIKIFRVNMTIWYINYENGKTAENDERQQPTGFKSDAIYVSHNSFTIRKILSIQ